jgi:hypothetical protein
MSEKTALIKNSSQDAFLPLARKKIFGAPGANMWRLTLLCLGICFAGSWTTTVSAQSFTVQNAKTELVDKVYRLDASLKYHFPPKALDALENGVTLILALDIEVIKPRRYMWDEEIATLEQRYERLAVCLSNIGSSARHPRKN